MLIPPELLPSIVTCLFFSNEKRISKKELVHYHKLTTTQYVTHQRLLQNLWWRIDYYNTEIVIVYKTNQLSVLLPPTHPTCHSFSMVLSTQKCVLLSLSYDWVSIVERFLPPLDSFLSKNQHVRERKNYENKGYTIF